MKSIKVLAGLLLVSSPTWAGVLSVLGPMATPLSTIGQFFAGAVAVTAAIVGTVSILSDLNDHHDFHRVGKKVVLYTLTTGGATGATVLVPMLFATGAVI